MAFAMMSAFETTACGRLQFEPHDASAADAMDEDAGDGPVDAPTACDVTAPFTSIAPLDDLNDPSTAFGQGGLRLSSDERVAYFHSNRGGSYEIYIASRGSRMEPFGTPVTTGIAGFYPTVTSDGLTMLYRMGGDILTTTRATTADPFVAGAELPALVSTRVESEALLDPTDSLVYFSRDIGGDLDLFVIDYPAGTTTHELAELTTTDNEVSGTVSADGLTLYFARTPSAGPDEIWVAQRASTGGSFGMARLLSEVNTIALDGPTWLSADSCRLYIESRRGSPDFRLYVAERAPN